MLLRGECFSVTERGMVCITMMCCNDVVVLPDASAWRMLDGGDTDMMGAGRESRFVNQAPSVHREPGNLEPGNL